MPEEPVGELRENMHAWLLKIKNTLLSFFISKLSRYLNTSFEGFRKWKSVPIFI